MLSEIRWMLGVAIGLAVVVAVWLEPDVRDPSGEPARPRPSRVVATSAPEASDSEAVRWQQRIAAYWAELDRGLADSALGPEARAEFQEALRARLFNVEERPLVRALDAGRARRAPAAALPKTAQPSD